VDSLDKVRDRDDVFITILRTIELLRRNKEFDHAKELLLNLLDMNFPKSFGEGRNKVLNMLSMAESIYFLDIKDRQEYVKKWLGEIKSIPLVDQEIFPDNSPKLFLLQFKYARLKFLVDKTLEIDQVLKDAENITIFRDFDEDDTRKARRQLALIAITFAKTWANGFEGVAYEKTTFLKNIRWIFDLIESGWSIESASFRLEVEGFKKDISEVIIECANRIGNDELHKIKAEFEKRWKSNPVYWPLSIQRDIVMRLSNYGIDSTWVKHQLSRIELIMLNDLDVYERVSECEKQTKAWLAVDEKEKAVASLRKLVVFSRGIYPEKDYQLVEWAKWLRKANSFEKEKSFTRINSFISRALSVEYTSSRLDEALVEIIPAVFDISPQRSVELYKRLLINKSIAFEDGVTSILRAAISITNPPLEMIVWILTELVFSFSRSSFPKLLQGIIKSIINNYDKNTAKKIVESIISNLRVEALSSQRFGWLEESIEDLDFLQIQNDLTFIEKSRNADEITENNSSIDYSLTLISGEKKNFSILKNEVLNSNDLHEILEKEDRGVTHFFKWDKLAIKIINDSSQEVEIIDTCDLMGKRLDQTLDRNQLGRILLTASEKLHQIGSISKSNEVLRNALLYTDASGWVSYWDGGLKFDIMKQMLINEGENARIEFIKMYAQELGDHRIYLENILGDLDKVSEILFTEIPYSSLWKDIEAYLDDLFVGIETHQDYSFSINENSENENLIDSVENALAELIIQLMDFPAYPVINKAISICSKAISSGNLGIKNQILLGLNKNDIFVKSCLIALEVSGLQNFEFLSFYMDEINILRRSPNIEIRMLANNIHEIYSHQKSFLPQVKCNIPAIYSIELPNISIHKTENLGASEAEVVLLQDPARFIRPLDIEAREIAKRAGIPSQNVFYRAEQIFSQLQIQKTWLPEDKENSPAVVVHFLEKINMFIAHNKPKIPFLKAALARVSAELYDAGLLGVEDIQFLDDIFCDHDPELFNINQAIRPGYIAEMGGFTEKDRQYFSIPKDWGLTPESSVSLLKLNTDENLIILGESTHLRRLENDWPEEDRFSLFRACSPLVFWDKKNPHDDEIPFSDVFMVNISGYENILNIPEKEIVIAHKGYRYQTNKANWIGLNPRVGYDMGWKLAKNGYFRWINDKNEVVVESIYWEDGSVDSFSRYDHTEVGYGWIVTITKSAYQDLQKKLGKLARGGVINRELGWLGNISKEKTNVIIDTPKDI
jgi:hypothetical protein